MAILKKILTVMVITLVLIVVAGGLYVANMGGIDHGNQVATATDNAQNKLAEEVPGNTPSDTKNNQPGGETGNTDQNPDKGNPTIIIQAPPPQPKTDPGAYVEALKEKINAINEVNLSLASNSSGQAQTVQPDGSVSPSGQENVNLHQEFYKLGKNVASMENTLEDLSKELKESQNTVQPQGPSYYYPYGYLPNLPQNQWPNLPPNYNQYYPQAPGSQSAPQTQQPATSNPIPDSQQQMNHDVSGSGLLNGDTINLGFVFVLLVSVVFAIIAVVGFIGSLFRSNKVSVPGTEQRNVG